MRTFFICVAAICAVITVNAQQAEGVEINGVVWADRNLDAAWTFADAPSDPGMFYQWNRPMGWGVGAELEPTVPGVKWTSHRGIDNQYAYKNDPCPNGWRIPNARELNKLTDEKKVFSEWYVLDGVTGRRFIDRKTNKSIFLPAAGARNSRGELYVKGELGYYWSKVRVTKNYAMSLIFDSERMNPYNEGNLASGYNIRCVAR